MEEDKEQDNKELLDKDDFEDDDLLPIEKDSSLAGDGAEVIRKSFQASIGPMETIKNIPVAYINPNKPLTDKSKLKAIMDPKDC